MRRVCANSDLVAWSGQSGRIDFVTPKTPLKSHTSLLHGSGVHAIAFSDDGSRILSAGQDGKIVVWSLETKQKLQTINAHRGSVRDADFVDAKRIISGGQDRRLCLSDIDSGEVAELTNRLKPVSTVAISSDGKRFAAGIEDTRMLIGDIDHPDDAEVLDLPFTYAVDMKFLDDPAVLVVSTLGGRIAVLNLPDLRAARIFRCVRGFGRLAFARKSKRLIVGAGDGAIQSIQLADSVVDEISVDCDSLNDARIIDTRAIVVCPSRGSASVMHLASGRLLSRIPDYSDNSIPAGLRNSNLLCVDESAESKKLAFGTDSGQILIWNAADAKLRVHGKAGGRSINVVRFAADSSMLVSGGEDGAISLWDLSRADASTELTRHGGVIRGLEFHPMASV